MVCTECGADMRAKDSRPGAYNSVRRRRVCPCGHRCTTYEIEVPAEYAVIVRRTSHGLKIKRVTRLGPQPLYTEATE